MVVAMVVMMDIDMVAVMIMVRNIILLKIPSVDDKVINVVMLVTKSECCYNAVA